MAMTPLADRIANLLYDVGGIGLNAILRGQLLLHMFLLALLIPDAPLLAMQCLLVHC